MPTPAETKAIRDFLFENPNNMEVAHLVHETWPLVRDEVCRKFLSQIFADIRTDRFLCECGAARSFEFDYGGDTRYSNWLWLYRESWNLYDGATDAVHPRGSNRIGILLENASNGPNSWFISIRTPESFISTDNEGGDRYGRLHGELKRVLGKSDGRSEHRLPWWKYVRSDVRNWESLVPRLRDELESPDSGEITSYFVETFVDFAKKAIPVIDEIESAAT